MGNSVISLARLGRARAIASGRIDAAARRPTPYTFAVSLLTIAWLAVLYVPPSSAHPGIHEQERAVDKALAEHPRDPDKHLARGKLHHEVGNWDAALEAFEQARRTGAEETTVATLEGNTYLAAGWTLTAKRHFEAALERSPTSPQARIGRARTWILLDRPAQAEADFAIAFEALARVNPALVLERRSALLAAGRPEAAIELLDAQIARVGLIPSLQIAAVDIDVDAKRLDSALRRLDALLTQSPRHPLWATRKAEILRQAGREEEAQAAYRDALTFVHARNARGGSRRLVELEKQLRTALGPQPAPQLPQVQQGEP